MRPLNAPEQTTNQVNSQYELILQFVVSEAGQVALGGQVGKHSWASPTGVDNEP